MIPPLPTQRKIAAILSAYDDLIENNTRRIAILEEMAQLLYREWFVHFRFPGHEDVAMVDSELGAIPEGWEVKQLSDLAEIVLGKTPSKKVPEYYDDHMLFIKIPDMRQGMFCIQTEDMLSEAGVESQANKTVPENSLCVSCIGTIGLVSITSVPSQTNQQINTLVLERPIEREFLYFALSDLKAKMENYGAGATMTYLSKTNFSKLEIIFPADDVFAQFHEMTSPVFEKIKVLQNKNRILRRARDLLLPRLVSGALDVADLPIDVAQNAFND
jgi:type I restriction enzyme S subunit